ncbi:hypothetical protein LTR50_000935 [Elasticomyces elasticus]|nr:hypothetical protein LTR50_000935 [Elasticomyces elasticus]
MKKPRKINKPLKGSSRLWKCTVVQIPSVRKARKSTSPCNELRSFLAAQLTDAHRVILVHGIGGHWKGSWEHEEFSWVKRFLQPDLEKAGLTADICSYGYVSRTSANSVANIEDVATALLGRIYDHKPSGSTIFVAHSLGGLVVKKIVGRESAIMRVPNEVPQPSDSNHVTINSFGKHERQRYQPIGNAIKELIKRAHAELERPVEEKIVDGADETEDSIVEKEVVNDQAEGPLRTELPTATDVFCGRAIELLAIAQALDPEKTRTKGFSSAQDLQSQTIERSYLAPLDRCKSLIDKHISPVALSPPGGRFCVACAEIAARLAQAYLYEGRLEEAKTCFHTAIESEMISQGDLWPSTETSFSLLRGLATACQKLGGLEDAEELRKSALTLSEKLYNRWDPRTAAISSHLSAVSQRRETMLQRHKSAPVATTGLKLPKEIRQTARTPDNAPARTLPSDNEEDYRELLEETRQTTRALENASVRIFPRAFQTRDNEEEYHELPEEVRQTARTQENSFARIRRIFSRAFQTRDNEEDYRDLALRQRAKFSDELLIASYEGDESMAKSILGLENLEVNSKDKYGRTPLLQAADGGYEAIVKLLLVRKDVVADSKDMYGCTPLFRAAGKGHKAIVKLLVARNDAVADSKAVYGRTPLSWAAERGHEAVVKLLVVRDDVLADSKDAYGRTPLSWAAENGHEAVVKLLLARNDVIADSKDNKGRTPLIRATWRRHEAIVKLLLAHNDVIADSKAVYGRTPLSWAAERGHDTVVKLLRPYATAELPTTPGIYELA